MMLASVILYHFFHLNYQFTVSRPLLRSSVWCEKNIIEIHQALQLCYNFGRLAAVFSSESSTFLIKHLFYFGIYIIEKLCGYNVTGQEQKDLTKPATDNVVNTMLDSPEASQPPW